MSEHNSADNLTVTYLWHPRQVPRVKRPPGWYVVRQCHCHYGHPVTVPFRSRADAERVMGLLLAASEALGT